MDLLDHGARGATIHLEQHELLLAMALIQEGRDSFECDNSIGRALDQLFCSAVVQVEEARRRELKRNGLLQKVGPVSGPASTTNAHKDVSNG